MCLMFYTSLTPSIKVRDPRVVPSPAARWVIFLYAFGLFIGVEQYSVRMSRVYALAAMWASEVEKIRIWAPSRFIDSTLNRAPPVLLPRRQLHENKKATNIL